MLIFICSRSLRCGAIERPPNTSAMPPEKAGIGAMRRSRIRLSARASSESAIITQLALGKSWVIKRAARKPTVGAALANWISSEEALGCAMSGVQPDQRAGEGAGVERLQVVDPLADADQLDRRVRR